MPEPEIVMLVTQIPCNSIAKRQDELLNVRVNYTYQGPAIRGRLGAVVTQKTFYSEFDEIGSTRKEVYVDLPASDTPVPSATDITGMPLAGCEPKTGYGIKVYALDLNGKPEWGCLNMLTISEMVVGYTLSGAVSPAVGGISGLGDYATGTSVAITAFLDSWAFGSYTFDHWGGDASGTSPTTTVYMDRNKHVIAYFKEIVVEKYTLTLSVSPTGAGSVSGGGEYAKNTWATIIASETNPDYEFDHWGGDYYGTSKTATVYMAFDKHVTAYFKPKVAPEEFQLIVVGRPAGYGTATKSPSKTRYAYGEVVTCTAHPAAGHTFSYWDCDGEWISSATSFNFKVLADHTLTAWFN